MRKLPVALLLLNVEPVTFAQWHDYTRVARNVPVGKAGRCSAFDQSLRGRGAFRAQQDPVRVVIVLAKVVDLPIQKFTSQLPDLRQSYALSWRQFYLSRDHVQSGHGNFNRHSIFD